MRIKLFLSQQPQLRRTNWNESNLFRSPSSSIVTQYRNPLLYKPLWQQSPQTNTYSRNGKINFNQQYYQSKHQPPTQFSYSGRNNFVENKQRQISFKSKGRSLQDDSITGTHEESTDGNWKHHYAHRDRRDLYKGIETTSPLWVMREIMEKVF